MGRIILPKKVKLFVGMLTAKENIFEIAIEHLIKIYGITDYESRLYEWQHTDYYEKEMGEDLLRKFVFFKYHISPESISDVKKKTNEIEKLFGKQEGNQFSRRINLDPGYITDAKVVLATTKDYSHRVYLRNGIYAEVELQFSEKSYMPMPYTYSDFRSEEYISLFNKVREDILRKHPPHPNPLPQGERELSPP
ncbi:MAG: DUF4416 family protein [Nitrospirota bacterium]